MKKAFDIKDGKALGSLVHGVLIEGVLHKNFVIREATVADLLDAEAEADITKPLSFNAALLARQIVSIGSYTDIVSLAMIRRLKTADWRLLREAQDALGDEVGEEDASERTS